MVVYGVWEWSGLWGILMNTETGLEILLDGMIVKTKSWWTILITTIINLAGLVS